MCLAQEVSYLSYRRTLTFLGFLFWVPIIKFKLFEPWLLGKRGNQVCGQRGFTALESWASEGHP